MASLKDEGFPKEQIEPAAREIALKMLPAIGDAHSGIAFLSLILIARALCKTRGVPFSVFADTVSLANSSEWPKTKAQP